MGYYTYFSGKLQIELKEPYLKSLQDRIAEAFVRKNTMVVNGSTLQVGDEWKNGWFMEEVVLFIEKHGKLISGSIQCDGEERGDEWEIFISGNKPFIREHGDGTTIPRADRHKNQSFDEPYRIEELEKV